MPLEAPVIKMLSEGMVMTSVSLAVLQPVGAVVGGDGRRYSAPPASEHKTWPAKEGTVTVVSMTGFARAEGGDEGLSWRWEAKSVNGRGLDVRLRLPPGTDRLEPAVRERIAARFSRGSFNVALATTSVGPGRRYVVNRQASDTTSKLKDIKVPTLVMVGDDEDHHSSGPTHLAFAKILADGIKGAKLVVLEGQGHHYPFVLPDKTNKTIRDFLAGR